MADLNTKIKDFANALYKALDEEYWGDIDPYFFRYIAEGDYDADGADGEYTKGLEECIKKALEAIGVS